MSETVSKTPWFYPREIPTLVGITVLIASIVALALGWFGDTSNSSLFYTIVGFSLVLACWMPTWQGIRELKRGNSPKSICWWTTLGLTTGLVVGFGSLLR